MRKPREERVVTMYKNVYEKLSPFYVKVSDALNRIRDGKNSIRVMEVRGGDKPKKLALPIVLWSGYFEKREDNDNRRHSGLVVLDFDHVNTTEVKRVLGTDNFVYACWLSPSGDGIKALVEISNPERHRDHFRSLVKYFSDTYGLIVDETGINESRACFESYDPDIVVKDSDVYGAMIGEVQQSTKDIEVRTDYSKLQIAANMIRRAGKGEKHNTLVRAAVLIGGYVAARKVEESEAFRILTQEIAAREPDDLNKAKDTIRDGIEKGKTMPISEIVADEERIRREMLIMDGDMSFISSGDEDWQWFQDLIEDRIQPGLSTGNQQFDQYFRFKREFVMVNGHSNIGKTTFMLWLMVAASVNHGWRWVLYSAENKTAAIKMRLLQYAFNRPAKNLSHQEMKFGWKWVEDHFVVIDNKSIYSYYDLLIFTEKILRQQHIDGLLIDPYNSLTVDLSSHRGVGTHEYHYEAASQFLTTTTRLDVAVWVNAHSYTDSQRKKDSDGYPEAPYAEDTEHGGKWVNRSDCFLTLHRKIQHQDHDVRMTTEVHVRKVRNKETGGKPTPLSLPLLFQMNQQESGFRMIGLEPMLFPSIDHLLKTQQSSLF